MLHSAAFRLLLSAVLLLPALSVSARQDDKKPSAEDKKAQGDEKKANEEAGKKAADEFDKKVKDVKAIPEKALLILAYGDVEPKDKTMVPPVARFLGPTAADLNFILVTCAADALGRFRGIPQAAAVLQGA